MQIYRCDSASINIRIGKTYIPLGFECECTLSLNTLGQRSEIGGPFDRAIGGKPNKSWTSLLTSASCLLSIGDSGRWSHLPGEWLCYGSMYKYCLEESVQVKLFKGTVSPDLISLKVLRIDRSW